MERSEISRMAATIGRQVVCVLIRYEQPLALLGLCYVGSSVLRFGLAAMSGLRCYVLSQWFPTVEYRWYGRWAVVTIEPDTLSTYYAEELAKKGMDIQLVGDSDSQIDLEDFASQIQSKYSVKAQVIRVNPDIGSKDTLSCILDKLNKLDSIGVLVNQLPARPLPSPHVLVTDCEMSQQMKCLVLAMNLTKTCLKKMSEAGSGLIVNIGDPSGDYPHPYLATYSASCAYLDYFAKSLQWETACQNVHVQSLTPYPCTHVESDRCTLSTIQPRLVARHAVNTVAAHTSRGYWYYGLRGFLSACIPLCLRQYINYRWNRPPCDCQIDIDHSSIKSD